MNFHPRDPVKDKPCCHAMEGLVNGLNDNTLSPFKKLIAKIHIRCCPECERFLHNLVGLHNKLESARNEGPSPEAIVRIRAKAAALVEMDSAFPPA